MIPPIVLSFISLELLTDNLQLADSIVDNVSKFLMIWRCCETSSINSLCFLMGHPRPHFCLFSSFKQCFFKNGPIPASFCFIFVLFSFQFKWQTYHLNNINWKKHRWCAWDSNPGRQYGRRRRIHWAMAAPHLDSYREHSNNVNNKCVCEKCPSSIWCWDSNTWPSVHESPPITTRPGLPPINSFWFHCNFRCNVQKVKILYLHCLRQSNNDYCECIGCGSVENHRSKNHIQSMAIFINRLIYRW